jgi:hypothetical protein
MLKKEDFPTRMMSRSSSPQEILKKMKRFLLIISLVVMKSKGKKLWNLLELLNRQLLHLSSQKKLKRTRTMDSQRRKIRRRNEILLSI